MPKPVQRVAELEEQLAELNDRIRCLQEQRTVVHAQLTEARRG